MFSVERQRAKKIHSFVPANDFESKKNSAIMINKICNIIKSDRSD